MSVKRERTSEDDDKFGGGSDMVSNKKLALIQIITEAISGFETGNWRSLVSKEMYENPQRVNEFLVALAGARTEEEVDEICWRIMQRGCPDGHLFARIATQQFSFLVHPMHTQSAIGYWLMNMKDTLYSHEHEVVPDVVLFAHELYDFMEKSSNRSVRGRDSKEYREFSSAMSEYNEDRRRVLLANRSVRDRDSEEYIEFSSEISDYNEERKRVLLAISSLAASKQLPLYEFYDNGFLTSRKITDEGVFYGASVFERIRLAGSMPIISLPPVGVRSQGDAMRALMAVLSPLKVTEVDAAIILEEQAIRQFTFMETRLIVVESVIHSGVARPNPQRHYEFPLYVSDDIKGTLLRSEYSTAYHKATQVVRSFNAMRHFTDNRGDSVVDSDSVEHEYSPLDGAIDLSRWSLVLLLIQNGADPLIPNSETGNTALERILRSPSAMSNIALIEAIRVYAVDDPATIRVSRYGTLLLMAIAKFWNRRTRSADRAHTDALAHAIVSSFSSGDGGGVTLRTVTCKDVEGNTKQFSRGISALTLALSVGFPAVALRRMIGMVDVEDLGPIVMYMLRDSSVSDKRTAEQLELILALVPSIELTSRAAILTAQTKRPLSLDVLLKHNVSPISVRLLFVASRANYLGVVSKYEIPDDVYVKQSYAAEIQEERSLAQYQNAVNAQIAELVEDLTSSGGLPSSSVTGRFVVFDAKRLVVVMMERGMDDEVVKLIERGEDLSSSQTGEYRASLLFIAAVKLKRVSVVKAILTRNRNAATERLLLSAAVGNLSDDESYRVVELLLLYGADPLAESGTALELILHTGDAQLIRMAFATFGNRSLSNYRTTDNRTLLHLTLPYVDDPLVSAMVFSAKFLHDTTFLESVLFRKMLEVRGGADNITVLGEMARSQTLFPVEQFRRTRLARSRYSLLDAFQERAVVDAVKWVTLFDEVPVNDDAVDIYVETFKPHVTVNMLHMSIDAESMALASRATGEEIIAYHATTGGNTALHHLGKMRSNLVYRDTKLHPLEWIFAKHYGNTEVGVCARKCTENGETVGDMMVKTLLAETERNRDYGPLKRIVRGDKVLDRDLRLELSTDHGWAMMLKHDKKLLSTSNETELSLFARSLLDRGIVPRWFETRNAPTIGYTLIKHALRTKETNDVERYFSKEDNKNRILFTVTALEYKELLDIEDRTLIVETLIAMAITPRVTVHSVKSATNIALIMRTRMGRR